MYTYRDYATGKWTQTRGAFLGWHQGQMSKWYAKFQLPTKVLYVREYLLSKQTIALLPSREGKQHERK